MKKAIVFLLLMCLVLTSFSVAFAKETFSTGMNLTITKAGKELFTLTDVSRHYDSEDEVDESNFHVNSVEALPTTSPLSMNKTMTLFETYNINGNNFFKLRDLADVIGFYVGWNAEKR